jgi:hypothetical protein
MACDFKNANEVNVNGKIVRIEYQNTTVILTEK